MSLPIGPFKKVEFKAPDSAEHRGGRIVIDDKIIIEPKSPKYYFLIQIVAGLQKIFPKYRDGISPVDVLGYIEPVDKIKGIHRGIKTLGSLKGAWRGQIQGGKNLILYVKEKGKPQPRRLSSAEREEKKAFLMSQVFPAHEVSREYYFKINVDKPIDLLIETGFGKILIKGKKKEKLHDQRTDTSPELPSIIDKYIESLSTDFRIRNIPFLGQYKDMLDKGVYIPRELLRQDGTSLQSREILKPGLSSSDPYEQIVEKRRTLIEGEPGSGKTILIRNIALNLAQNFRTKQLIPLYVELRAYDPTRGQRLDSYAFNIAAVNARFTPEETLEFENSIAKDEAKLVFLLDGYDEVRHNPEILKKAILSLPTASKAVITSRKYLHSSGLAPDLLLELKPFNRPSQRLFLENAVRAFGIEKSLKDRLLAHIGGFSPLSTMLQNPLFLLCICFAAKSGNDLPRRRIELLRQVKAGLLDHYITKLSASSQDAYTVINYVRYIERDGVDIFDSIYCRLAFQHFSNHQLDFSHSSIINLLDAAARKYNVFQYRLEISDTLLNCGLLVAGSLENTYSFVHPLIMEYFAGQELTRKSQWKSIVLSNYLDPFWRNVIIFFVGLSPVAHFNEIYELLAHQHDYFHSGLLLVAQSIGEMPEYPPQMDNIIEKLCTITDRHPLKNILLDVLFNKESVSKYYFSETASSLVVDRHLNRLIMETLVKKGASPYLDKCLLVIYHSNFVDDKFTDLVRYYTNQINPEILAENLLKSDDKDLNYKCVSALRLISSDLAESILIEALMAVTKDNWLRYVVAEALEEDLGTPGSIKGFMQILTNDKEDFRLRGFCARALGHFVKSPPTLNVLGKILSKPNEDIFVRKSCAKGLQWGCTTEALNVLIEVLVNESDIYLRCNCARALGNWGGKKATETLIAIINNSREEIYLRSRCVEALGNCGDEGAITSLVEIMNSPAEKLEIRIECSRALGKLRPPEVAASLVNIMTHKNALDLKEACAGALLKVDKDLGEDVLTEILGNPNANTDLRIICSWALESSDIFPVDNLRALLADGRCKIGIRRRCAAHLCKSRSPEALPELTHGLSYGNDLSLRCICARSLGNIGLDQCVETLQKEVVVSEEIEICKACIEAIGTINSQAATLALEFIESEMEKRRKGELAWQALQTLAAMPNKTSLSFCVHKFRTMLEDIRKENQNQSLSMLDNKLRNQLYQLLNRIHTLSHQFNTIVPPESLGLSDVLME